MKLSTRFFAASAIAFSVASCTAGYSPEPSYISGQATVTFKPSDGKRYYMEVGEQLAFYPLNSSLADYPFSQKVEKRAMISYLLDENAEPESTSEYKNIYGVYLQHIDTIKIKQPLVYDVNKEGEYGHDPLGLYLDNSVFPTTLIEDGYLNLVFSINYGSIKLDEPLHDINLLIGVNPDDPYEVEVRHNAHGDISKANSQHCICNFPLKALPDTEGKTVKLTLKWFSSVTGKTESVQFDYCSRTDW